MSAHAGIFRLDSGPVVESARHVLAALLAEFGPDRVGEYADNGVYMLHRALHVTPEDRYEQQPYRSRLNNVMTWDGRLDNRDELIALLWRDLDGDTTDVALAMAVYDRWGRDGFSRLIGDWSLAVWDKATQELTVASDYMGVRPLYYYYDPQHFAWSSTIGGLVGLQNCHDRLSEDFLAGFLFTYQIPDLTPYADIRSVTPAHSLTVTRAGHLHRRRYWDFGTQSLRYRDARQYEEHLRHLFRESVRARLRAAQPVWAELSGGLDSSSVVCMADLILKRGETMTPGLRTISLVFDESRESDERPFVTEVERALGTSGEHVPSEAWRGLADLGHSWLHPKHPKGALLKTMLTVTDNGSSVLMTGMAGDAVMANSTKYSAPLLATLREHSFARFLSEACAWSHACEAPLLELILHLLADMVPPLREHRVVNGTIRYLTGARRPELQDWQAAVLVTSTLEDRIRVCIANDTRALRCYTDVNTDILRPLLQYSSKRSLQTPSELPGLVCTHPFTARPLVDFVLGIPPSVLLRPGEPRALMRDSFQTFLPARIRRRFSKGYAEPAALRRLRPKAQLMLGRISSLEVVQRGYVDPTRVRTALQRVRDGVRYYPSVEALVAIEEWLAHRRADCRPAQQVLSNRLLDSTKEGGDTKWSISRLS